MTEIRQETLDLDAIEGVTRVEDVELCPGKMVPCYELGGFCDTLEGWTLFCECIVSNPEKYQAAKAAWRARQEASA